MASILDGIQGTLDEVLFAASRLSFESVLGRSAGIPGINDVWGTWVTRQQCLVPTPDGHPQS